MIVKIARISVLSLAIALSVASMCFAADKKQLTAAVAAVDANLKTSAGKQYDDLIGKEFPDKYWSSVRQCKQSLPAGAGFDPFDMFLKLNTDGKVQEALVYPETPFALCVRTELLAGKFSSPPHDDYWINIHLQLKP
jgi:hypothetical protein